MIVEVARNTGRSVRETAEDSYAVTLYTFLQLQERDRLDLLLAESSRLDMAYLNNYAFNDPPKLSEAKERFKQRLKQGDSKMSRAEAMRRAASLMMRIRRAEKPTRRKAKG